MNVFLAFTPYHLLMSCLSVSRKTDDAIVLIDQFGTLQRYADTQTIQNVLGVSYYYLPSVRGKYSDRIFSLHSFLGRYAHTSNKEVLKILAREAIEKIFVFNDSSFEAQFFLRSLKCDNVVYVEDGTAPYNSHQLDNSRLSKIRDFFLYGPGYQRLRRLGESSYVNSGLFSFPEHIASGSAQYDVAAIGLAVEWRRALQKFSSYFQHEIPPLSGGARQSAALVLLPSLSSLSVSSAAREMFSQEIERLLNSDCAVVLKFHPLDSDFNSGLFDGRCVYSPQHVPAEVLMNAYPNLNVVVGDYTTGLLSCRFLFPEKSAVSLDWNKGGHDTKLLEFFRKIGVSVCG